MNWNNGSMHWNITFARAFHDWEINMLTAFIETIYSAKIRRDVNRQICWRPIKSGIFEVKSFY